MLAFKADYSCDSILSLDDIFRISRNHFNSNAFIIFENSLDGAIHFSNRARANGIKPIFLIKKSDRVYIPKDLDQYCNLLGSSSMETIFSINADEVRVIKYESKEDFEDYLSYKKIQSKQGEYLNDNFFIEPNLEELTYLQNIAKEVDIKFPQIELDEVKGSLRELIKNSNNIDRVNYELEIIDYKKLSNYFLLVKSIVAIAEENNIAIGPGRGSAPSSLVCYLLGITSIDPIKYDLMFERFLNKKRADIPDIDLDIDHSKRDFLLQKVREKHNLYGLKNYSKVSKKMMENAGIKSNLLEGKIFRKTNHSVGFFNSKNIFFDIDNSGISSLDSCELESLGGIKIDLLPLKAVQALDLLEKITKIKLESIPLDDKKSYLGLVKDSSNIFQLESDIFKKALFDMKPGNIEELAEILAICRPGANKELIYQEELIKKVESIGIDRGEAELLTRSIIKKKKLPISEETIEKIKKNKEILNSIKEMGEYLFNKAHAISYAHISYYMAYFKFNYPKEFISIIRYLEKGEILRADINWSEEDISFDGLLIEGLDSTHSSEIVNERRENGIFTSLEDLISRTSILEEDAKKLPFLLEKYNNMVFIKDVDIYLLIAVDKIDDKELLKSFIKENIGSELEIRFLQEGRELLSNYKLDFISLEKIRALFKSSIYLKHLKKERS